MSNYIYEEASNLLPNQIAFTIYTQSVTGDPEGSGIGYWRELTPEDGYVSSLNDSLRNTVFTFHVENMEYKCYINVIGDSFSSAMNLFAIETYSSGGSTVVTPNYNALKSVTIQNLTKNLQKTMTRSYVEGSICSFHTSSNGESIIGIDTFLSLFIL